MNSDEKPKAAVMCGVCGKWTIQANSLGEPRYHKNDATNERCTGSAPKRYKHRAKPAWQKDETRTPIEGESIVCPNCVRVVRLAYDGRIVYHKDRSGKKCGAVNFNTRSNDGN